MSEQDDDFDPKEQFRKNIEHVLSLGVINTIDSYEASAGLRDTANSIRAGAGDNPDTWMGIILGLGAYAQMTGMAAYTDLSFATVYAIAVQNYVDSTRYRRDDA